LGFLEGATTNCVAGIVVGFRLEGESERGIIVKVNTLLNSVETEK
jgi:hypothetical protein